MSKWRPDGWKNPYSDYNSRTTTKDQFIDGASAFIFEAGANAMLETLRLYRGGEHHNAGELGYGFSGTLVFIPDDTN